MNDPVIAGTIGPDHDAFSELLAGLVDGELGMEEMARMEEHLALCPACRRELESQVSVRTRLMQEGASQASPGLAGRVMEHIARQAALEERVRSSPAPASPRRQTIFAWTGWLLAAGLGGIWLGTHGLGRSADPSSGDVPMGAANPVTVDSHPGVMSTAVLHQFHRVDQSELPRGVDLAQLKREVPFHVTTLRATHMRFIAAWTTEIQGEPAAAIAYRCHDRLVVQYVISERHFFRNPQVREAIADQGLYAVSEGAVSTIAWADLDSASFLVGEFSPSELAAMRL